MAQGLSSVYDEDYYNECVDCDIAGQCFDDACEYRVWFAKCGSIDYTTGEIANIADFCELINVTAFSHSPNYTIREKNLRGCKRARSLSRADTTFSLSWVICQGDDVQALLLGSCPFDYVLSPKGNNLNFEQNPSIFDQTTKVLWGRAIGDNYTWEYPDDDCQETSRDFMTDRYCWETEIEAAIPTAEPLAA